MIWSKKIFEKNAIFDPKIGLFAHKMGRHGVHWGLQGQFWVFEGPRPFGSLNIFPQKMHGIQEAEGLKGIVMKCC